MAFGSQFKYSCVTTMLLVYTYAAGGNGVADPVRDLSQKLQDFQLEFNENMANVLDTIKRNRKASKTITLENIGSTNATETLLSLQSKIDKVGKLLYTVADLIWDRAYFATSGGKIMVHSAQTGDTRAVVDNHVDSTSDDDGFHGITHDPQERKMYFSSRHAIYRANLDGSVIEMAFSSMKYQLISGLAFDWLTGRLFGVSTGGIVFTCEARVHGPMKCKTVLKHPGTLRGIAVDPENGTMYLVADGEITQSNMDGSGVEMLMKDLKEPFGRVVQTLRAQDERFKLVMWADSATAQIGLVSHYRTNSTGLIVPALGFPVRGFTGFGKYAYFGTRSSIYVASPDSDPTNAAYNTSETINHIFTPSFKYEFDSFNDFSRDTFVCFRGFRNMLQHFNVDVVGVIFVNNVISLLLM